MDKFTFGYDDNLGLPQDFVTQIQLPIKSYHDLGSMLQDFIQQKLALIFLPVGALPYLSTPYHIIAEATIGEMRTNYLTSKLVTAKNLTLAQIPSVHLGRVNQYCTTSFWAPLIYFMQHNQKISTHFIDTNGFDDMLDKVAQQKIDSAMVWDKVLNKNPDAANKVQILASSNHLPAPIIISNIDIPDSIIEKITHFKSTDQHSYFNGFSTPNLDAINLFVNEMAAAKQ